MIKENETFLLFAFRLPTCVAGGEDDGCFGMFVVCVCVVSLDLSNLN